MQQHEMELRLFVRQGHGEPSTMRPPRGERMGPLAFGADAEWVVSAPGVLPTHGYVYYDGSQLFFRSTSSQSPIHVDGQAIPQEWTAVTAPCELRLGMAVVAITGEEPEPEVSDAAATQKIVPLLAANMVRKAPPGRLKALPPDEMVTRQLPAEAFSRQGSAVPPTLPASPASPASPMMEAGWAPAPRSSPAPAPRSSPAPASVRREAKRTIVPAMDPADALTTVLPARGAGPSSGIAFGPRPKVAGPPAPPEAAPSTIVKPGPPREPPRPAAMVPQSELLPRPPARADGGGMPHAIPPEPSGWLRARWRQTSNVKKAVVVILPPVVLFLLLVLRGGKASAPVPGSAQKPVETAAPEAESASPPVSAAALPEAPSAPVSPATAAPSTSSRGPRRKTLPR